MNELTIINEVELLPALPEPGSALSADEVLKIEAEIVRALPVIRKIPAADEWRRRARGIEMYLRSPELQRPMLGAQRRIEARIGQLLGPLRQGERTDLLVDHDQQVPIDRHTCADFRLLARALDGECSLLYEEWRKSRRSLIALIRDRLGLLPEAPTFPEGKFACLVVDPPWQVTTGPDVFHGTSEKGNLPLDYRTLSVEDIKAYKDKAGRGIADLPADDAHLYLWTINRYLEPSYEIARAWGFKPSTVLTWCKEPRGIGLGDTFRLTTEFILFCRRGSLPANKIIPTTWFQWPRGRHSKKPEEFYRMVESVTPGNRADLFARAQRDGWCVWGDEIAE